MATDNHPARKSSARQSAKGRPGRSRRRPADGHAPRRAQGSRPRGAGGGERPASLMDALAACACRAARRSGPGRAGLLPGAGGARVPRAARRAPRAPGRWLWSACTWRWAGAPTPCRSPWRQWVAPFSPGGSGCASRSPGRLGAGWWSSRWRWASPSAGGACPPRVRGSLAAAGAGNWLDAAHRRPGQAGRRSSCRRGARGRQPYPGAHALRRWSRHWAAWPRGCGRPGTACAPGRRPSMPPLPLFEQAPDLAAPPPPRRRLLPRPQAPPPRGGAGHRRRRMRRARRQPSPPRRPSPPSPVAPVRGTCPPGRSREPWDVPRPRTSSPPTATGR